jgi:hypothetical protein
LGAGEQFESRLSDPSIKRARVQLTKRVLSDPEIKAMVRDQCYSELRYSVLSTKYSKPYAAVWFFYGDLLRKLVINVLFLIGQNSGVHFQWKLWVFMVLAGSVLLNVVLQPHYHAMDNRQEAIALTGLLLILYVASTEGQIATGGQWHMDIESQSYCWVQAVSLVVLLLVVLVFIVTFAQNSQQCRKLVKICTYSHAKPVNKAKILACLRRHIRRQHQHQHQHQNADAHADAAAAADAKTVARYMVQYQVTIITHENDAAPELHAHLQSYTATRPSSGLHADLTAKLDAAQESDDQPLVEALRTKLGQGAGEEQGIADAGVDSSVYAKTMGRIR